MSPTKMILIIIPPRMARTMSQLIEPNSTSESTRSKIIKDLMGKKKLVLSSVSALFTCSGALSTISLNENNV